MTVNQNRNSIRVLRTTGVGYLAHKNIPDFSVGGQDLTIQLWVVKAGSLDGLLYGQEGGFSLQLVDGKVVFTLPGCVVLAVEDEWALSPNRLDYIALRSSQGKYTLFINGIPAAEKTATAKAAACSGTYYIGKNFAGGLALVRVSGTARSDRDILSDNALLPGVDEYCVFQSDCSTAQYMDVSANRLPLWAEGFGAGCGIYTACTAFSGDGQVSCDPREALPAAHTLLLKLWPQDVDRRQQVYAAMDGDRTVYALELLPQKNSAYKIAVTNGDGARAVSEKTLLPRLWQDVAAVFEGGKLTLYVDGQREGTYSLPISGGRSTVLVGSEYESGRPYYEKGFFGYVAYTAEFGRVLPADEIALYADDPPFMFEDGLVSLLPLDWPNEVESIGATPLQVTGSAPFTLEEGITPRDGSVGVSVRLPAGPSPEWEALSEDEKWAFRLFDELMLETATKLRGYPMEETAGDVGSPAESLVKYIRCHAEKIYVKLVEMDPCVSEAELSAIERELFDLGGKLSLAYERLKAVTAGIAGACSYCKEMVGAIAASSTGIAAAAVLGVSILIAQKKRKKKPGNLEVTGISWDHRGDPTCGGVHYHLGGPNLPKSMIDGAVPGEDRLKSRCVLVMSKLDDLTLDVTLTLGSGASQEKSGTLRVESVEDEGSFGLGGASADYSVGPGGSVTVSVGLSKDELPKNGLFKIPVVLQFRDGNDFLTNCDCDVYLLPGLPIAPWVVGDDDVYDPEEEGYVRLEFADLFLQDIRQPSDIAAWAVQRLNESGFRYDDTNGECCYCWPEDKLFNLAKFVKDLGDVQTGAARHILNCSDCAYTVYTACAMTGTRLPVGLLLGFNDGRCYFYCNQIIAVGCTEWAHPFEDVGGSGFSYHMFNIVPRDKDTPLVYDACLKVDGGDYPGVDESDGTEKTALLPMGIPACETDKDEVAVPTDREYKGNFYRERLVRNGVACNLFPGYCQDVYEFYAGPAPKSRRIVPDEYVLQVMKMFSLAPTPEEREALEALPKRAWRLRDVPGLSLEWESEGYASGSLADPRCRIKHWSFESVDEAAARLGAAVAYYATPHKYPGYQMGVDVGERCVVIAGLNILFRRLGHVFAVRAGSLADALSAARLLDRSVGAR